MDANLASLLLSRLTGGTNGVDGAAMADPAALRRRLVAQMLQERLGPGNAGRDALEEGEPRLDPMRREVERLRARVGQLTALVRYIGETFGACPLCWGSRSDCPRCCGGGRPGTFAIPPEREPDFLAWVESNLTARGFVRVPANAAAMGGGPRRNNLADRQEEEG